MRWSNKYELLKPRCGSGWGIRRLAFLAFYGHFSMLWIPLPSVRASAPASGSIGAGSRRWTGSAVGTSSQ